ncbi:MAG: hypothetical protein KAT65_28880 [Methanophagales archaeon]|nr:hypothetical protein [Methanophagales archaeon]
MYVWLELVGKEKEKFDNIQAELGLRSRAEVVRHLIARFRLKRGEQNAD